eukprot:6212076-Pleurochrysis_carterae.AAC.5
MPALTPTTSAPSRRTKPACPDNANVAPALLRPRGDGGRVSRSGAQRLATTSRAECKRALDRARSR